MAALDLDVVARYAGLAPSVHNTQPWRIEAVGDTIEVRADRTRQLSFLDPTGRQLHVSCGAAVEFGYLAVRDAGRSCAVDLLPEPADPDLISRLRIGAPEPASPLEIALAEATPRRYTDRGPYDDRPVPAELLDDIHHRCGDLGVWARVLDRDQRSALVLVLADAEAAEAADPRYAEELSRWTSGRGEGEGIPPEALPAWPADTVTDVPLRDFAGQAAHPRPGDRGVDTPPGVERDTVLMIGTGEDEAGAWVSSGRALGWGLLRIAAAGLAAQPLGQAIDLAAGRARLRREFDLVGHPQFLLRVGYGAGQPATQRRSR
jgi:hypothetical protein